MDYTDAIPEGKKSRGKQDPVAPGDVGFWWREGNARDRAMRLIAAARDLKQRSSEREQSNLRHARLYGNFDVVGFNARDHARQASLPQNRISLNVVASCVDTLGAKIAKSRPRPSYLTDGGSFKQQRAARRLDKFWRGVFHETDIYNITPQVFFDGNIFDLGVLKGCVVDGRLQFERVFPGDLFVDDADGLHGKPRQMFQCMVLPRECVLEAFGDTPAKRAAIKTAKSPDDAYWKGFGDMLEVWEAWHLASGKKAGDGVHCIAIGGATGEGCCELEHEEWKLDQFPFAFYRYSRRVRGFWGQGLAERLSGIQVEINRLLRSLSEQLRRKGKCRLYVPLGSKVVAAHLTNGIGDIVYYAGPNPPTVDNVNAIAPEEFLQLDRLYQRAYQEAGISELSAGAKKPSGLDAAVAIREFNDVESERFALVGRAWETLHMDAAVLGDKLLHAYGSDAYRVRVPGRRSIKMLQWGDVSGVDEREFIRQMFPVSSLPQTPGYRLQRIQELEQGGYIDKATARRLLDFPDIEAENDLAFAAIDDVDETISAILDEDEPRLMMPDDFTDPLLLVERATAAYLRIKHQKDVEPERIDMLISLVDAARAMVAPPPAAPGPAAPGAGAPMPMAPAPSVDLNFAGPAPAPAVPPLIQ